MHFSPVTAVVATSAVFEMLRVFNFAAVAAVAAALQVDMDPTLQLMQTRIRQQAVYEPNIVAQYDAEVAYSLTVLTSNYTFSDLDYSFQQPAIWPAYNHTKRMEWIASCWQSPASAYYNNATILDIAVKLLDWWLINGPNSKQDNWWWWTIGVPITLGITTNVLSDHMLPNQTASANLMLSKANPSGYTACNLIWTCEGTVYRAVLTNNYTLASYALNLSYATIVYAPGTTEGIKEDGSFYQVSACHQCAGSRSLEAGGSTALVVPVAASADSSECRRWSWLVTSNDHASLSYVPITSATVVSICSTELSCTVAVTE